MKKICYSLLIVVLITSTASAQWNNEPQVNWRFNENPVTHYGGNLGVNDKLWLGYASGLPFSETSWKTIIDSTGQFTRYGGALTEGSVMQVSGGKVILAPYVGGAGMGFLELDDTPDDYTDHHNELTFVTSDEDSLIFTKRLTWDDLLPDGLLITSDDMNAGFAVMSSDYSQYALFNYHNIGLTDGVSVLNMHPSHIDPPNIRWNGGDSYLNWSLGEIIEEEDGPVQWYWHPFLDGAGAVLADPDGDGHIHLTQITDIFTETDPVFTAATSDDLAEGASNLYYTDERAQDAIGLMVNSSLQYVDGTPLLAIASADFGDITTSSSGTAWSIDAQTSSTWAGKVTDETGTGKMVFAAYPSITVHDNDLLFQDNVDNTKEMRFQLSGITTASARVLTVPDASGTIALTNNKLSTFAATTSAELAGVLTDETGTGSVVFSASPTLTGTAAMADATLSGMVTNYNGIATTNNGIPASVATITPLTGQTAAISATTIYTTDEDGWYQITVQVAITTTGGTAVGCQIKFTNQADNVEKTMPSNNTNGINQCASTSTANAISYTIVAYCKTGTAIKYATFMSGSGQQYSVNATVIKI